MALSKARRKGSRQPQIIRSSPLLSISGQKLGAAEPKDSGYQDRPRSRQQTEVHAPTVPKRSNEWRRNRVPEKMDNKNVQGEG